jgi:tRNA dimethylallyltransferase
MKKAVVIFGPTASGKTSLSIEIALKLNTEIVSMDSQQIYKELFIGTARPTNEEMKGVPHHLIGHVSVHEEYNVSRFLQEAMDAIDGIISRGKIPLLCGGSYMWLMMALDGFSKTPPKSDEVRAEFEELAKEKGIPHLHAILAENDPESAEKISPNDLKRLVRALEIFKLTGKTRTEIFASRDPLPYDFAKFAILRPRDELYDRINTRVDNMVEAGLLDEVKDLVDKGLEQDVRRVKSHGYPPLLDYYAGKTGLEEALDEMKLVTRHYAKRQLTFMRSRKDFVLLESPGAKNILDILEALKWTTQDSKD